MNYKQKYAKYKNKYLILKNQYSGSQMIDHFNIYKYSDFIDNQDKKLIEDNLTYKYQSFTNELCDFLGDDIDSLRNNEFDSGTNTKLYLALDNSKKIFGYLSISYIGVHSGVNNNEEHIYYINTICAFIKNNSVGTKLVQKAINDIKEKYIETSNINILLLCNPVHNGLRFFSKFGFESIFNISQYHYISVLFDMLGDTFINRTPFDNYNTDYYYLFLRNN
jgi:hypothetical protein